MDDADLMVISVGLQATVCAPAAKNQRGKGGGERAVEASARQPRRNGRTIRALPRDQRLGHGRRSARLGERKSVGVARLVRVACHDPRIGQG